jgi:DNA polymerase
MLMELLSQKVEKKAVKQPNKVVLMQQVKDDYSNITNHPFHDFSANKIVFGVGSLNADLAFIGEGPGRDEDIQGEPFVGRAGKLLTQMIIAMGLARKDVFISNVIKCRLPKNRAPIPFEVEYDKKYLHKELEIVQPRVICLLGASALSAFFDPKMRISQARGKFFDFGNYKLIPTYHPAYLLRNPSAKTIVWSDLQAVMKFLKEPQ